MCTKNPVIRTSTELCFSWPFPSSWTILLLLSLVFLSTVNWNTSARRAPSRAAWGPDCGASPARPAPGGRPGLGKPAAAAGSPSRRPAGRPLKSQQSAAVAAGETRGLRPRPPWNAFFLATHLQPVTVFLSLINVLLFKFTYAASARQEDLIITVATMFWGKWCFVSIQNHRLKIYLLLQKRKLLLNFFCLFVLQRGCWKQAKRSLDDPCFTILRYFLLLFHLEKLSRALEQCCWGMHHQPEAVLRELKVR